MTNSYFGFCRDCDYWDSTEKERLKLEKTYSRDIHPDDGYILNPCNRIRRSEFISLGALSDADKVITDANFGCRCFKAFKNQ